MNSRLSTVLLITLIAALTACGGAKKENTETADVKSAESEWITLFNGETFDGWKTYGKEGIPEAWTIVDGALVCNAGIGEENVGFSSESLMTTTQYGNFEFELEYKIAKGGNSGIFYHVVEADSLGFDFMTGPEYQVLDDEFSRSESEAFKMVASNYAMQAPAPTKKPNPYMQWNKVKIVYNNGHVEHWFNGEKVLEFEEGSDEWKAIKAESKWANTDTYAAFKKGAFSLQNHGDEVHYRNIRVKAL